MIGLVSTLLLVQAPPPRIDSAAIRTHVAVLAADSLRGRATPSPGLEAAARYLALVMQRSGLVPFGDGGTFIQRWPFVSRRLQAAEVSVRLGAASDQRLEAGRDYFLISAGRPAFSGPIFFRGPIAADTAFDRSVKGRIVALTLDTAAWSGPVHALMRRMRAAGAQALVVILEPGAGPDEVAERARTTATMEHTGYGVPVVAIRREVVAEKLRAAGYDPTRVLTGGRADLSRLALEVAAPFRADSVPVSNVVGLLEGADPKLRHEYLVVSAHFDHLGIGNPVKGDSIYNGADDNASGTAAMLEIGRILAAGAVRPKRSIIFLGVSGEENGIFGSLYFTEHPPVPRDRIVADLNLDGIGRAWQRDTVSAVGRSFSDLGAAIERARAADRSLGLTVVDNQWPRLSYFETSDQLRFAEAGIPSVFFSSAGPHPDYHQPSDELGGLSAEFTARIASLAAGTVLEVANAAARPRWLPTAPDRFRPS